MNKKIFNLFLISFFILLFLFPAHCIEASKKGLLLWFNVIVPTLFPFIILSYIIVNSSIINWINRIFSPIFKKLLGISGYGSYALIMGSISGYPMGAIIVNELLLSKHINKNEANFLLSISNNASPMFIIGFICTGLLNTPKLGIPMLLTIYISNLITALIIKKHYNIQHNNLEKYKKKSSIKFSFSFFDTCINHTAEILVKVGGYIIMTSIPIILLSKLPISSNIFKFFISLIELSNGASLLASLPTQISTKFSLLCSLCAFGSLSVVGQTASAIKTSNLSIKKYFLIKLLNGIITLSMSFILVILYQFLLK